MVENNKIEDLLLKLLEEMAIVKSKLEVLDELKDDSKNINARVDKIEAMNERHNDSIQKLEHRANVMEQYQRDKMIDSKKQMTSVYISMGMALLSAVLSIVSGLLF
jgi:predicted DNA binding CopG/RHH family protein